MIQGHPKLLERPQSPLRTQFIGKEINHSAGQTKEARSTKNVRKTK